MRGKPFVKGDPRINVAGRPVGATDQKWHDIKWWYNLVLDNYQKLSDREKVELGLKGMALLISKIPILPATPDESVQRVIDVHGELEKAEANANTRPTDDAICVGTSETEIQT